MEDYSPNPSKSEEFLAAPQFWSYPVAQSLSLTAQDLDPGGCRNAAYWPASEFLQEGDHMSNRMLSEIYGGSRWMFPLANQLWSSYDSLPDLEAESDQIREDFQEPMLQLVGSVDEGSSSEERYPYYVPVSQHACECHTLETEQMKKVWISSGIGSNDRHETGIHDRDYLGLDGNQREPPNKLRKLWDSQEIPTESQHCALNLQSTEDGMHKSSTLCSTTLAHSNLSSTKPIFPKTSSASAFRNKPNETRNIPVDPQSVAARERRKRISERVRCLEKLIPGGSKMDTASMLDEAIRYVKFLQIQVNILESLGDSKNDSSLVLSEELQEVLFRKRCCVAAISQSAK